MTIRAFACLFVGSLFLAGCRGQSFEYTISVKNESPQPLMVGLAKDGPPFEDKWASPEQVSRMPMRPDERGWGIPVASDRTAEVAELSARLERTTTAYLRVYANAPTLPAMLAISSGSPNRLDVPLVPGVNKLIVTQEDGRLAVRRVANP